METTQRKYIQGITVEPVLCILAFSVTFADSIFTNLMLRQSCRYEGFEFDNCTGLAQIEAQRESSYIENGKLLIESCIPSNISFFIGPWSDTHGRKIVMIFPITGYILYYCGWSLLSLIDHLNPIFLLSNSLFIMVSGGSVSVAIACYCYLTDITEPENRAFRIGLAEISVTLGGLFGIILSPIVYNWKGFWAVFTINALLLAINLIYIIFFIEETVEKKHVGYKNPFKKINPFQVLFRKRKNYGRPIILLVIWISIIKLVSVFGENTVRYMSTIAVFNWDINKFSTYNIIYLSSVCLVGMVGFWLGRKILKLSENILLLFSLITKLISGILMGVASISEKFFYISSMVGCTWGFIDPLVKSKLTNLVKQDEVGKIYPVLLSLELICPLIAAPFYTTIYAALVYTSPFAIYFVSAFFNLTGVIALVIIMILSKKAYNRTEKTYSL